jgi:hypothetical protein
MDVAVLARLIVELVGHPNKEPYPLT